MNKQANNQQTVPGKAVDNSRACLRRHFTLVYPQLADRPVTEKKIDDDLQIFEFKRIFLFTH